MATMTAVAQADESALIRLCAERKDTAVTDTTYHLTMKQAITAANKAKRASMLLLGDVRYNGAATSSAVKVNLDIDLNGYSIGDTLSFTPSATSLFSVSTDTVTLTITSSRPGGRLWTTRAHSGAIYVLSCSKGQVVMEHVLIEVVNTAPDTASGASTRAVSIGARGRLLMNDCTVRSVSPGTAYGLSCSGDSLSAACITVRNSRFSIAGKKSCYGVSCLPCSQISDCEIDVQVDSANVYGLSVQPFNSGYAGSDTAQITRTHIRVHTHQKAYALYVRGHIETDDCTIEASADSASAYCVYAPAACEHLLCRNTKMKAMAPDKAYIVNKSTALVGKIYLAGGFFSHKTDLAMYLPDGYAIYRLYDGAELQAGYLYTIQPVAHPNAVVARLYNRLTGAHIADFTGLADALWHTYLNDKHQYTIVIVGDCQLEWGTYLIPSYVTLVVGYKEGQKAAIGTKALRAKANSRNPQRFARLTLLDDAEMIVEGVLEVSGMQQAGQSICGTLSAEEGYGQIHLMPAATISVERGARLQAWGYITGTGVITAHKGAELYEFVQLGGWKGGTVTYEMLNNPQRVFPITHFFYQNIECPVVYHAGSKAYGATTAKIGDFVVPYDNIMLIDTHNALFVMDTTGGASPTVRKEYDPLTDRITWATDGHTALDEMNIHLNAGIAGNYSMESSRYVLPLNTNMTIRAQSGCLTINNDMLLPPGVRVEIAPQAQVRIPDGTEVYVYDADQYGIYRSEYSTLLPFSPSWQTCPRDTIPVDAQVEVRGEVIVEGALYTTDGGAAVTGCDSVEGRIVFVSGTQPIDTVYQLTGTYSDHTYTASRATMPVLLNADSTYTSTLRALPNVVYTYSGGRWSSADTMPAIEPDTIPAVEPDTLESLISPYLPARGRIILQDKQLYILLPDGRRYSLSGTPIKQEETDE